MACSKPIRVPREWTKFTKEATTAPLDKELLGLQEMIDWAVECELCDEELVKQYCKKVHPYFFMRSMYPVIPDDTLCREIFKVLIHFVLLLFVADDQMELQSEEEGRNMCAGFAQLDDRSRESFPEFPTVEEMKKIVTGQMSTPSIIGPTVFFGDFVTKMASILLKHGNYSHDVVYDFRLRTSNMILLYIQAVAIEKHKEKQGTVLEVFWRRIFGGCAFSLPFFAEVFSGALGSTKQHVGVMTEIFLYSNMLAIAVNDLYSYFKEKDTNCDNMFGAILSEEEEGEENISEAVEKIAQICEAILKCAYEKIKKKLKRHPELRSLFDISGRCIAGWLWIHCFTLPRYAESSLKFTLVEVDDEHLSTWLSEKPNYGDGVIKEFLGMANERMEDVIMDALCGAFPIHKKEFCI